MADVTELVAATVKLLFYFDLSLVLTFPSAELMAEDARVKREAQEAKAQVGDDKREAEQDSTKTAAEGLDSLLEGDDLRVKEAKDDLSSQGELELYPVAAVVEKPAAKYVAPYLCVSF